PGTADPPPRAARGAGVVLAAGDCRQDRYLRPVGHGGGEALEEAYVFSGHVDVDEAAQRAVLVRDPPAQLLEALEQAVEHLLHSGAFEQCLGFAPRRRPQLRGDLDDDRHQTASASGTPALNAASVGSIVRVSNVPRTASSVFRPSPVITSTTRSSGSMSPRCASFASTAVVTPPAVSVKMPVVSASSEIPARISSSLTLSTEPPVRRASSSA